jgi:hypothetical protein
MGVTIEKNKMAIAIRLQVPASRDANALSLASRKPDPGSDNEPDISAPPQYASRAWHLLIAAGRELNGKLRVKAVE